MYHKRFETAQECWAKMNEGAILDIFPVESVYKSGTQYLIHDCYLTVDNLWIDPKFDFGLIFGYTMSKWTRLVKNYVDEADLEIAKSQILVYEQKTSATYNVSLNFSNKHIGGKGCLSTIIFTRRPKMEYPQVTVVARASEITKRLLFDFLLVQKMVNYIYGKNTVASMVFICPQMWSTQEILSMYNGYKPIKKIIRDFNGNISEYTRGLEKTLERFQKTPVEAMSYRVHQRAARQLQISQSGEPISDRPPLLAGELLLFEPFIEFPEDVITPLQRKEYLKTRKREKDKTKGLKKLKKTH